MSVIRSLFATIAFGAFVSSGALAADLQLPPQAPPLGQQERLEFGTGWYLRGDISWAREKTPVVFGDPALAAGGKVQNSYSITIGGGYKFNSWFRTDLTYDYIKETNVGARSGNFTCYDTLLDNGVNIVAGQNSCYARQNGRLNRHVLLGNAYVDLGTWSGVTPYIGVGAGSAYGRMYSGTYDWYHSVDNSIYVAPPIPPNPGNLPWVTTTGAPIAPVTAINSTATTNRRTFNLAWALMAGVAYDISPNAKIDLGYRYLNLGKFGSGSKSATVNEYRIGFRYMID